MDSHVMNNAVQPTEAQMTEMPVGTQVTPIDRLVSFCQGSLVRLPDFAEGQQFIARVKRPSMLALVKNGKIPNSLLTSANTLFAGNGINQNDESSMSNLFDILDTLCEACFVEPTYQQMKDAGVQLTDDQYMAIFNYTQKGVKALDSFREE